ncbi:hypothetical protein B9Z47_14240 [Limnohabitans sp. 2KL-1]|nr:hypothetical protein B9Z47_14240 [Limnohabitans sp. 2KL-1]
MACALQIAKQPDYSPKHTPNPLGRRLQPRRRRLHLGHGHGGHPLHQRGALRQDALRHGEELLPISLVASAPNLLVVNNDLPVKSVPELIAYMKANPNKLSFGSHGTGTSVHVSGELFKSMTGTSMTHVPYKGRQFAIPDLVGGSIQLMFDNMPSALPMARDGKIRALAQTTAKRSPAAPDVPTMAEFVPGFEATTWFAMFAPANVPKPIIDKLNAEVVRVFHLPEVQDRLKTLGLDPVLSTPEELARYQAVEITKWAKVVKDSGAKAE